MVGVTGFERATPTSRIYNYRRRSGSVDWPRWTASWITDPWDWQGQTAGSHGARFRTTTYGGQTAMGRRPARTARHLPRRRACRRAGHDEFPDRARPAPSPNVG